MGDELHSVFSKTGGVASAQDLRASGITRETLRRSVRQGTVVAIARGVYSLRESIDQVSGDPRRMHGIAVAAVTRRGSGLVASHTSAARLHALETLDYPDPPPGDITVTHPPGSGNRSSRPSAQVHVYVAALPSWQVTTYRGVPVTSAARTVIDIARTGSFLEGAVVADSALRQHLATQAELAHVAHGCAGWPGSSRLMELVRFADDRAESVLETLGRVRFREHRLESPDLQVNISGPYGFIGRVDFCWWQLRTVAEADGAGKYQTDPLRLARDQLRRDELLREAGWGVVHFGWREMYYESARVCARVRATFRARR